MEVLAKRLKWLREKERYSQKDIANKIGMTPSGYQKIEYSERDPKLDVLVELCNIFDVSADFLLGRNNELKPLRELEFEITMHKTRTETIKSKMHDIVNRIYRLNDEIHELEVVSSVTYSELDIVKISSRKSMIDDLVKQKEELEATIKSISDQYGDAILNYMFLLSEIPDTNPRDDRVLKNFLPFKFHIQEDIFGEYSISLFGENIGHIGYKGSFSDIESAETEIKHLDLLYNGR